MNDLTPWFPPEVKPVREGVYEIRMPDTNTQRFSWWTGGHWAFRCDSTHDAAAYRFDKALGPITMWRGLASKPRRAK